ncbi:MAG: hypothetical protein AAF602_22710 [Myxococcota bacterium]
MGEGLRWFGLAFAGCTPVEGEILDRFPTPGPAPRGIIVQDGDLLIPDLLDDATSRVDPFTRRNRSLPFVPGATTDVAFDDTHLWMTAADPDEPARLTRWSFDGKRDRRFDVDLPIDFGPFPTTVAWDPGRGGLWMTGRVSSTTWVWLVDPVTGQVRERWEGPESIRHSFAADLDPDGQHLWVADGNTLFKVSLFDRTLVEEHRVVDFRADLYGIDALGDGEFWLIDGDQLRHDAVNVAL